MRKLLATAALVTTTLMTPGVVPEAHAGHDDWFAVGSAFRVGAAHISFVFGRPVADIGPAYYFRYDRPISYRGHDCNRYCFRERGHYYHHEACPVVGAHFSRYDHDPYYAFSRYAPRHHGYDRHYDGYRDRYRSYGYRDRGYRDYDRHDRYDRGYDRHDRYERRYDRRGRYDRHDRYYDDHRRDRRHKRHHRHNGHCRH